jgi:hypothetical protein
VIPLDHSQLCFVQIRFCERFKEWSHFRPSCILDSFVLPIQAPPDCPWDYYNRKIKSYGVVYQICYSFGTGKIVSLEGPFPGACSDIAIFRKTIGELLLDREQVLADKAYQDDRVIAPHRGWRYALTREERQDNYKIYRVRQAIERLIQRLKNFRCFNSTRRCDLDLQALCVRVAAKLTNINLQFEPLDS